MEKYYGIFEVCIDSYQGKDALKKKKTSLYCDFLKEMKKDRPDPWGIKVKTVYESRTGNDIQSTLFNLRLLDKKEDQYRRGPHRFKMKYFIHEVDELGWLKLSKKEQADAEELLRQREEAEKKANN